MHKITIISNDFKTAENLASSLERRGFDCVSAHTITDDTINGNTDLVLLDMDGSSVLELDDQMLQTIDTIKRGRTVPVIALLDHQVIWNLNSCDFIEDFLMKPWMLPELEMRIRRSLHRIDSRTKDVIDCGDLTMDMAQCVVTRSGEQVDLTFTEYELLKFMMLHKGKVYSRHTLLDKVWGYDYYGGERTVDVHIRRLRSKIEDVKHIYIETVRNVGYKFDDFGRD